MGLNRPLFYMRMPLALREIRMNMKEALKLKIGAYWCITQDAGISIEMTSPLWNDSGSFSYAFTVPYSANRHIFNAANLPESDVNLKNFRERFELYVNGVGLLFGDVVCTSDEIDEDDDRVELQLRAANATFEDAIEGKTLRDLDFGQEALMAKYNRSEKTFTPEYVRYKDFGNLWREHYPVRGGYDNINIDKHNTSDVYPNPFIYIPVLVMGESVDPEAKGPLFLSAKRQYSSPCFFVLYVLKKIFSFVNWNIILNELENIEDFRRLIFINTSCKYRIESTSKNISGTEIFEPFGQSDKYTFTYTGVRWDGHLFFTSENLPNVSIGDLVSALKNAFGVRIITNDNNTASIVLLKNILKSADVQHLSILNLVSVTKTHEIRNDIVVRYANEEGDEYAYSDYSNPRVYKDYNSILNEWYATKNRDGGVLDLEKDIVLKIARDTGNFFRTKVDKEKFDEPQLFEVAQFLSYSEEGEGIDKEIDEISIGFNPIIPTTTSQAKYHGTKEIPSKAFYADVNLKYENSNVLSRIERGIDYRLPGEYETLKNLLEYDCGFTLGIVRTTPDKNYSQGYTIVRTNADGFGNDGWVRTVSTTEVTSDSLDVSGAVYDYNGAGEGVGVNPNELISLKIWNNKQNFDPSKLVGEDENGNVITGSAVYDNNPTGPLPNRGLVPQFLSEYLYFLKNRKTLSIVCELEIAELVNIKWDKYYNIAGYRCLLNKISFDIDNSGIGLVTMEVYCI